MALLWGFRLVPRRRANAPSPRPRRPPGFTLMSLSQPKHAMKGGKSGGVAFAVISSSHTRTSGIVITATADPSPLRSRYPNHMKYLPLLLLLCACGPEEPQERYASGFLCTCEQRTQVGEYVARNQTNGISDDSDYYMDRLFKIAVMTHCDHLDSVHVRRSASGHNLPIGAQPCEEFFDDMRPIR